MGKRKITHEGIVQKIKNEDCEITIINYSACAACHAQKYCMMSDKSEKIINVQNKNNYTINKGDKVIIEMDESMGWLAVIFAFILPLFLLLATIFTLDYLYSKEIITAMSIAVLIPYYLIIFLLRDKFDKKINFYIKEIIK